MQNVDASAALVVPAGNSGDLLKQVCRRFQAQSRRRQPRNKFSSPHDDEPTRDANARPRMSCDDTMKFCE